MVGLELLKHDFSRILDVNCEELHVLSDEILELLLEIGFIRISVEVIVIPFFSLIVELFTVRRCVG